MQESLIQTVPVWLSSLGATLVLAGAALVGSTVLAFPLALASFSSRQYVRRPVFVYSWVARSIPPLIFLYGTYYGLSALGLPLPPMQSAIIAFIAFATAYTAEILRGGLKSIDPRQYEAARALGLPERNVIVRIVLPQVLTVVTPAYLSYATALVKETSLASVVAVGEVTGTAERLRAAGYPPFAIILIAATIYLGLNSLILAGQQIAERRGSKR